MTNPHRFLSITAVFLTGILAGLLLATSGIAPRLAGISTSDKIDEAISLIRRSYIEPPDEQLLIDSAIRGMTELLDPYSIYVDAKHLPSVREEIDGNFGGVGMWFEMVSDTARVVSVFSDSPSERAGILPGDRIVSIGDSTAVGVSSLLIQNKIKGPEGTTVELTLYRSAINRTLTVSVERAIIPIRSVVAAFMLDDSTAYLRLARFSSGTASELRSEVGQLLTTGASRLLLDLRDNPGGLLEAAVAVSDELLPAGYTIVSTEDRSGEDPRAFRSSEGGVAEAVPLIVLVNENSASASEIVAGAVQDNDRGLVVGRPTFGKGLVQSQYLFDDGSALHLTVARYHTPAGRPIQNRLNRDTPAGHGVPTTLDPDSLSRYTTVHGRTIIGGEGIYPDVLVELSGDEEDRYFRFVMQSGLDLGFVREWFDDHEAAFRQQWADRKEEFLNRFVPTATQWNAFNEFARAEVPEAADRYSTADVSQSRSKVLTLLKGRLGQLLYGPDVWQPIVSRIDPEIDVANRHWTAAAGLPPAR